jgi:hypothetical protein
VRALAFRPKRRAIVLDLSVEDSTAVLNAILRDRLVISLPGETLPASRFRRDRLAILADRIRRAAGIR